MLVPFIGAVAAVPDARVTVTDATVDPATPTAGEPMTVTATVQLSAGSDSAADLDRVRVVDSDGNILASATGLGSLSPGETLDVPISVTVDEPGARDLSIIAKVSDTDGETATATRPLPVVVEQGAPLVEVTGDDLVANADSPTAVTVSNPTTAALRDLTVTVVDPSDGERTRRTVASLAAGGSRTLNFSVRPDAAGETTLDVRVAYTTAAGTRANVTATRPVEVAPLSPDVGVRVETASDDVAGDGGGTGGLAGIIGGGNGGLQGGTDAETDGQRVDVTVTNFGNAPVDRVVLVPRGPDGAVVEAVGRVAVTDALAPGEAATVTVDLAGVETVDELSFVAEYGLAGERREAAVGYGFQPNRGAVALTGLNVSVDEDGLVTIDGNLGNVGESEVAGVVVEVGESEVAAPAYPDRSYFVGTVGASEFAPFAVTATVDAANATSVPVEVTYTTGGDRVVERVEVPLPADRGGESGLRVGLTDGFGLLDGFLLTVGGVAFAAVGLVARRYR